MLERGEKAGETSFNDMSRSHDLARDFGITGQIQRASVSIMSNIAEGFERSHVQEKLQFYNVARSSSAEVRSLTYVIEDNFPTAAANSDLSSRPDGSNRQNRYGTDPIHRTPPFRQGCAGLSSVAVRDLLTPISSSVSYLQAMFETLFILPLAFWR